MKTGRIDSLINSFKKQPHIFNNNVWHCYTECKKEIVRMEQTAEIECDSATYHKYIDYITEKLDI